MLEIQGRIGKASLPLSAEVVRELTTADLVVREAISVGAKAPSIKSLRATHHKLAQVLAMGFSDAEASANTGYSPSRISILKGDPTFKELMAFYGEARKEIFVDVQQRMAGFAVSAVEVLQERLEDKPESFSNKDLNSLIKTTADRGGHSPINRSETRTVVLSARDLEELKKGVAEKQNGQIRKVNHTEEALRVRALLEGPPGSNGPEECSNDNGPAQGDSLEETPAGGEGEGPNL